MQKKFEELLHHGKINQVPKKPYHGSDTLFHLFVDSVVSVQNTPRVIQMLFAENINNYLSWYDSVKNNLPYKDIQKNINPLKSIKHFNLIHIISLKYNISIALLF